MSLNHAVERRRELGAHRRSHARTAGRLATSTRRQDARGAHRPVPMEPSNTLAFLGQFTMYTFVSVLGWRVESARRSSARFCSGAAPADSSVCGTWANLARNPRRTAVAVLAGVVGAIVVLGSAWPAVVTVIVAMAVWNGAFGVCRRSTRPAQCTRMRYHPNSRVHG
jgi:hypothetical protein